VSRAQNVPRSTGATRYGSANVGVPGGTVSYGKADAELLRGCISAVAAAGDCIMFSTTSDGGACSVRVLSEGVVEKWYPSGVDDLQGVLVAIRTAAEAALGT
jgi:hypothetical protein